MRQFVATPGSYQAGPVQVVSLRCPSCHQTGTFEPIAGLNVTDAVVENGHVQLGQRKCPNPNCRAHVFFAWEDNALVGTYPAMRIDFDTSSIPTPIVAALTEAITCHANACYVASAIMVRKTLEVLCDERQAEGDNLKTRIQALIQTVVLPKALLDGLDELRLLGNDAAHVESQAFKDVGEDEVDVAIDFTKEVLKGVYQSDALVAKLRALKKKVPPATAS